MGVYIHVPFCEEKCDYCSFHSVRFDPSLASRYIEALQNEIEQGYTEFTGSHIDSVYFGGGTPSLLDPETIDTLLSLLRRHAAFTDDVEVTIETNPSHFELGRFLEFGDAGVSRVSCGIQTLDQSVYERIGRKGGFADDDFLEKISSIPQRLAFDIISGVGASVQTLEKLLVFPVDHYSVYMLSVDEGTPLHTRGFHPDDELQRGEYLAVCELLNSKGFDHYEISNFARNEKYSRHNLKYWNFDEYCGFGAGAHSFIDGERRANALLAEYLANNGLCRIVDKRTTDDAAAEYIMTKLRLRDGLAIEDFTLRFGETRGLQLKKAARRASIAINDQGRIALNEEEFLFLDSIVYALAVDFIKGG